MMDLPFNNISSCSVVKSPMNAELVCTLFNPLVADELTIAFGIAIPIKHPRMMPIASPQMGVEDTLLTSSMIKPTKVPMKVPSRSD